MNMNEPSVQPEDVKADARVSKLQSIVYGQACLLFPNRTPSSAFMKLYEEMGEVIKDPTNPMEWADVFILMLDLSKMFGINITEAVLKKMAINQGREWQETPTGTWQHTPKGNEDEH